jgi:Bacterial protein of unknown function (DUF899)
MTHHHTIGTAEEHLEARLALLEAEKELTRRGDELARQRQALPWVPVEKEYVFDTDAGERTLLEFFDGRSQLLVYHFMFGPRWSEGCPVCSFWVDSFNGAVIHLAHHDVTMLCASRAPVERLQAYKRRMGWSFPWVWSDGNKGPSREREAEPGGRELRSRQPAAASLGDVLPRRTLFCARLAVQHCRWAWGSRARPGHGTASRGATRPPLPRPGGSVDR